MSDNKVAEYLSENPKLAGVLFTIMLLLTQAGGAMAAAGGTYGGP